MNIILIIILLVIILILIWALLGGKSDIVDRHEGGVSEEDRTFRRRASDKEIEKEFPESAVPHRRRKSDMAEDEAAASAEEEQQGPFKLPYMADEIIPETSRFRIYRRTLLNSEIYATKGDYSTAISLFEGVRSRIQDIDTRFKIDADIEYLKQFKKKKEEDARRKDELAKRGATGEESSGGGEIKIKMGGLPSNAIKIDSLPETIHIGIIDPSKNVDMESIVKNVTDKLKSELSDVREELDRLKAAPQEDGEAAAAQSKLADALSGLTERLDSLESAREASAAGEAAAAVSDAAAEARAALESLAKTDELADLKNEFKSLTKAVKDMAEANIPEAQKEPSLAEAKFDMGRQMDEARALKEMLDRIPKKTAPEPSPVTEPGIEKSEHLKRSAEDAEEKDDFELLSEYGKDKSGEELTDDEIFEKILREDKKERDKGDFEIIGEKKERRDEDVTTTEEIDMKQREDESFYRRLLSTTKRKTKELPILKVSYDFTKLPDEIGLSREKNIIEYSFYKYKPMLEKANEYIKKRKVRDAINYYKVVMSQNIPPEFKSMIRKNLSDLTEYLEKYLTGD